MLGLEKIITAVTGASGAIYARRFIQVVNESEIHQTIIITDPGKKVLSYELDLKLPEDKIKIKDYLCNEWGLVNPGLISYEDNNDITAAIASGSRIADAMVIIPSTMGTAARISHGLSSSLLERTADVILKERKKLVMVPRETPLNQIHLENLLTLSKSGVDLIPAMPAFYHQPETIDDLTDFIVGRVLEHLSIEHNLYRNWRN